MTEHARHGNGTGKVREPIRRIVVSRPDSAFETVMIPLEGELREALTVTPSPLRPPRRDSMFDENGYLKPPRVPPVRPELFDENGYLKPPRLPRPNNLRWWERLAYAWRGL